MLTVEMLPAKYGDAVLVTWGAQRAEHRMLIDGGLSSAYPTVARRLHEIEGRLDLFVITHVDLDHIGGSVKLLRTKGLAERLGGVWFNGYKHLEQFNDLLGPLDGEKLSNLILAHRLPWNAGWPNPVDGQIGGPVVRRDVPPVMTLPGGATATVLSPTPSKLKALLPVWTEVLTRAGLVPGKRAAPEPPLPAGRGFLGASLADLADAASTPDDAAANGSSIAFVFEFDDKRILFGGDAHPDALLTGLEHLAPPGGRYRVDACKLPHHGSGRNVTKQLVRALDCSHWWFSSNGVRFGHPSDEALARVIRFGTGRPTLAGNYRSARWAAFTGDFPPADHGYDLVLPGEGTEGLVLTLG